MPSETAEMNCPGRSNRTEGETEELQRLATTGLAAASLFGQASSPWTGLFADGYRKSGRRPLAQHMWLSLSHHFVGNIIKGLRLDHLFVPSVSVSGPFVFHKKTVCQSQGPQKPTTNPVRPRSQHFIRMLTDAADRQLSSPEKGKKYFGLWVIKLDFLLGN